MGQADDAVAYAMAQVGKPYVFATAGPKTFDCSGLTQAAYAAANPPIHLPHYTGAQILLGREISLKDIQPGDLTFPDLGHVQIYAGNGQVIEAASTDTGVIVSPLGTNYLSVRRVATDGKPAAGLSVDQLGQVAKNALQTLGAFNPLAPAATLIDVFRPVGVAATTITNINFWRRAGQMALGSALVILGVVIWNRRSIESGVVGAVDTMKSIGGTAVQGFTFGFGAGKATGPAGGSLIPEAKRPKPPAPASTPVTAVPVTSPARTPISAAPSSGGGMTLVSTRPYHATPVSQGGRATTYGQPVTKRPTGRAPIASTRATPRMNILGSPYDPNAKGVPITQPKKGKGAK